LAEQPKLRLAVGVFQGWPQLREALHDLRVRGLVLASFNCLALAPLFAGKTILAPDHKPIGVEMLPFAQSPELIACTSGPLADCLMERIASGAQSLKEALSHWLIPRHAGYFQDAIEAGRILFWIEVSDADDERVACRTLLSHSLNSVGVHDFRLPPPP
jgi:hypothetical protein